MAKLGEFVPFSGEVLRLCDRCDTIMVSGYTADQVFLKLWVCNGCYQRQRRAEDQHRYSGAPPVVAPSKQKHGHKRARLFPEMPQDFRLPGGIEPRLQGLRNLKKAGKMEAYERVRQEILESLMRVPVNILKEN